VALVNGGPIGITAGPDGTLRLGEGSCSALGRITSAGATRGLIP